jgi:hypothetical protein
MVYPFSLIRLGGSSSVLLDFEVFFPLPENTSAPISGQEMHMDGSWIKSILKAFLALFQDISRSHFFFLDDGTFRKESRPDGRGKESLGNGDEIS